MVSLLGQAKHLGPSLNNLDVEVFNVGRFLTHGDYALDTDSDFMVVVEHKLVPARARSENQRLKRAGFGSVWAPDAGVGLVSLRGASLSMPKFAAGDFSVFYAQGRVLGCHLPIAGGRVVHLVLLYGFQGVSTDPERLRLTEKLVDSVLCELAVVGSGQSLALSLVI